ncbi:peptidoglycan D,D-transpeptidase FtsI family protein [Gracilibacillus alcaliphilus]|uniref:peptidoglycan D,D-transpeptidase FtsI family protein n=1 Tax=Gracilibacillus alcaliphilus TaxID=1401441 RepID=UPI00195B7275|nr:penicillin-binding protein 2 [Gracilibacillus alcaliphilus]MBM7675014.1 cell division protein FtsI/penicillin-binding protein 2 [Gracilibacillus alcaliphilus]
MDFNQDFKKGKKKLKKKKSQLPFRLNILFISVFAIFSLLIIQLGVVQILNGEEAQRQINQTENTPSEKPVPRGKFYDSQYNLVLDNQAVKSITYTPPKNGDTAENKLKLAEDLANYITIYKDEEELEDVITDRDRREYYYLLHAEEIQERLTEEEEDLDPGEKYQEELKSITDEELASIDWNHDLLNVIAIKKELDAAYELSPHVIVNEGLTDEEYAKVSEHLPEMVGIDAVIDWDRKPLYDDTFSSFLGNLTSSDNGIPDENSEYYLANGYTWNDRVGTSGLEQQYEHVLRGRKEKVKYTTDTNGTVINSEVVVEGQRGKDIVLTVDMDLQEELDNIVEDELRTAINHPVNNSGYLEDAMAVLMDPRTGEILAMSAIRYDREEKEYLNNAYRNVYDSHAPGSSIKGATVLAGYQEGVIDIGTVLDESPIKIRGSAEKSSYAYLGSSLNDVQALEKSSNAYMMRIALRISGATYQRNEPLYNFNFDAFNTFRNYYSQFGLGVSTGVDLPFEANGVIGTNPLAGNLLDLSFGNYDAYTTLQLAQYVATIANDGYRMRPHLVKEIREPGTGDGMPGKLIESIDPEVLNRIDMEEKYIERVQEGFRRVFTSGTAQSHWSSIPYEVAGKTGTAQNPQYVNGEIRDTENLTLVGYSPAEDPEVAFAVVVPKNGTGSNQYPINHEIGKRAIEAYYELKDKTDDEKVDEVNDHEEE